MSEYELNQLFWSLDVESELMQEAAEVQALQERREAQERRYLRRDRREARQMLKEERQQAQDQGSAGLR